MKPETRLVGLLKAKGLRLVDLANRLDVDRGTVTRWSQKEIPLGRLKDIEAETGISARDLRPDLAELLEKGVQ
jgi:transcriptional regulator with XRE-family HTH domain